MKGVTVAVDRAVARALVVARARAKAVTGWWWRGLWSKR
jgi:hypothetical protein